MNKIVSLVFCALMVFGAVCSNCSAKQKTTQTKPDTVYVKDTVYIQNIVYVDTFKNKVDSLNEELFVAKYKLERVKYYNSIATGSKLKYLRGWLNRVLNN